MIDYELIYDSILKRKCILVLGPELVVQKGLSNSFFELFIKHLEDQGTETKNLYNEDGFFHFMNQNQKLTIKNKIVHFSKATSLAFAPLFENIAKIPFHLIFQVSSDIKLQQTYRDLGLKHKFLCYNAKSPTREWQLDELESDDNTLLVSLLLDYNPEKDYMNDAVLSYEDFISFIRYFYGTNALPNEILIEIKNAEVIIFLGYRFDKWYWNLIFDLFNFPDPSDKRKVSKANFAILNQNDSDSFSGKTFYERQYESSFEFLDIESFIEDLYQKFVTAGKQRKVEIEQDMVLSPKTLALRVIAHCKNAELTRAVTVMNEFDKIAEFDKDYLKTIYHIIASFNDKRKSYAGRDRPKDEEFDTDCGIPAKDAKNLRDRIFPRSFSVYRGGR